MLRATLETPAGVVLQPIAYGSPVQHRRRRCRSIYASCGTCYVVRTTFQYRAAPLLLLSR